jgi:hypothetical protein
MNKVCLLLMVLALGLISIFPPWVLVRTVFIYGDGFWSLEEKTRSSESWTEMKATQEICRLGHYALWKFNNATPNPSLSIEQGAAGQAVSRHSLGIAGPLSVRLDLRLMFTEYSLVLLAGLLWRCCGGCGWGSLKTT